MPEEISSKKRHRKPVAKHLAVSGKDNKHKKLKRFCKTNKEDICFDYGNPLNREWNFLKFSYSDGAPEEESAKDSLFKFSIPEGLKGISNSVMLKQALESITPSVWVEISRGCKKLRTVCRSSSKRSDLFSLKEHLYKLLEENKCPAKGICEKRTDIYMDLLDELIRQVAIDHCPEAGQILVQIRDHFRETLLLHKLTYENSQAYAYRKQIPIKDSREVELRTEIDGILKRKKELVDEMRCIERGIILSQERIFFKVVLKARRYRQNLNYYRISIIRSLDLLDACLPPEFKDAMGEIRERELEKKREAQKLEEQRKKLEGEVESEKTEELEDEEVEEEEAVKTKGIRGLDSLIYRSDEEEVFEESTSEEEEEGSSMATVVTPVPGLDMAAEKLAFKRLLAVDDAVTLTLIDLQKGEAKPFEEPVVVADEPAEGEKKEEVQVKKYVEEEEEPEEETESDKERARRRKLAAMGGEEHLDEEKEKEKEEEEEIFELDDKEKVTEEEKVQEEALEHEEEERKAQEEEAEELEEEEFLSEMFEEELEEEEGEGEMEAESIEIVSTSSPSESEEEEEPGRKEQGKRKPKAKSTVIITRDLVDVEMGETDSSDFEEEEEREGSQAS